MLAGRYRLVRRIAAGGTGEVWEGVDDVLARPVALKLLHPHLVADEAVRTRFRREATGAARLQHPNIVAIYDTVAEDAVEAIVMELVAGPTLRDVLDRGALEAGPAIAIAAQVAAALDHAHRAGVVHRDVKPANVLLAGDGRARLADLGLAKALGGDVTRPDSVLGTARYLAPEQVRGEPVDGRADVYALGVVLFEMVCGRPPFAGDTEAAIALQRLTRDPVHPRQLRPGLDRGLCDVILRAMAREPDQRFATAGDLRSALLDLDDAPDTLDAVPALRLGPGGRPASPATPPHGTAPTFRETERSWLLPAFVIVLAAAALGVAGVLFARTGVGRDLLRGAGNGGGPGAGTASGTPLAVSGAAAFDPGGDSREHDELLGLLTDGNDSTAWRTERYNQRTFGTKPGVGVVLTLASDADVSRVTVTTPATGWAAQVYVAAGAPPTELAGWGTPVSTQAGIAGSATFTFPAAPTHAVLVWLTDLGDAPPRVSLPIAEITIAG